MKILRAVSLFALAVFASGCGTYTTSDTKRASNTADAPASADPTREKVARALQEKAAEIAAKRAANRSALFFGALLIVPLFAVDRANDETAALEQLAERRDALLRLRSHRKCPQSAPPRGGAFSKW